MAGASSKASGLSCSRALTYCYMITYNLYAPLRGRVVRCRGLLIEMSEFDVAESPSCRKRNAPLNRRGVFSSTWLQVV